MPDCFLIVTKFLIVTGALYRSELNQSMRVTAPDIAKLAGEFQTLIIAWHQSASEHGEIVDGCRQHSYRLTV